MDAWQGEGPRKAWGQTPVSEVLKILEEAELQPITQHLDNSTSASSLIGESLIHVAIVKQSSR